MAIMMPAMTMVIMSMTRLPVLLIRTLSTPTAAALLIVSISLTGVP